MDWTTSALIFLAVLATLVHSLVGLVAIWAALGGPHWFLRIAVLGGVLALGLPVPGFERHPAYDLMLMFLTQSVIVIVPLLVVRYVRALRAQRKGDPAKGEASSSHRRLQFSILDLLLATVVAAVLLTFAVNVPRDAWWMWQILWLEVSSLDTLFLHAWVFLALIPALFALSALVAAWSALGRRRLRLRLLVLLAIPLSWLMAAWLGLLRASGWLRRTRLAHGSSAAASRETVGTPRGSSCSARVGLVLLSLAMLAPLGTVYVALVSPTRVPEVTLPNPNGYDGLVRAGEALSRLSTPNPGQSTAKGLAAPAQTREELLEAARAALKLECRIPVQYAMSYIVSERSGAFRELGRAFDGEGELARVEGRTAHAVQCHLDTIRIGRASARGSLIIGTMVDYSLEDLGLAGLRRLRSALTADQARALIADLKRLDADREPLDEIFYRDRIWEEIVFGWQAKLLHFFKRTTGKRDTIEESIEERSRPHAQVSLRLLICDLAIRVYHLDHGSHPQELRDLVPEYLSAVPEDPFTGEPPIYRPTSTGYKLYSVGYNRRDDGGRKPPRGDFYGADVVFD